MKKNQLLLSIFSTIALGTATAQTPTLIKDINTSVGSISDLIGDKTSYFMPFGKDKIFFCARDNNADGNNPYLSDGTAAGTIKLSDVLAGDFAPTYYHLYDAKSGKVFFTGKQKVAGKDTDVEPWVSDGTAAGTKKLKDIGPGVNDSSEPVEYTAFNNKVCFAVNSTGNGLWISDGTEAGTTLLATTYASQLQVYKNKLYFVGKDKLTFGTTSLWESDGTVAGTKLIFQPQGFAEELSRIHVGSKGMYLEIKTSNKAILNAYNIATNKVTKLQTQSQGAIGGTVQTINGKDYFLTLKDIFVTGSSNALVETDATLAGTKNVKTFTKTGNATLMAAETFLILNAEDTNGEELWISDGTAAGTKEIDLNKGTAGSFPRNFKRIGNTIYFSADYNNGTAVGIEPCQTDGTVAGTKLLADLNPGATGSDPANFVLATLGEKTNLVFSAIGNTNLGKEPYKYEIKVTTPIRETQNTSENDIFTVQPNPAKGTIFINTPTLNQANADLNIYNMQGALVKKENITTAQQAIDIQNLATGTYILQITTKDAKTQTQKLVIF